MMEVMEYNQEDRHLETLLPVDLVDENFAEEDDMNDGVPVQEYGEYAGEGENPGVEQTTTQIEDYSLNHTYKNHLMELSRIIKVEIQRCKEKQEIISKRIQDLEKQPINPVSRKNWYHLFGYPYFKDKNFFPCPMNGDQRQKLYKKEIDYHKLPPIRRWTESDCLKLEEGVKANAIERKTSGLLKRRGLVLEGLKSMELTKEKKAELKNELNSIENAIKQVKSMDLKILVGDINTQFDWLKIAAEEFGELRSSEEVQAMWALCRHPLINRKHWTRSENKALNDIAKQHKEQNWAIIASELNTNRSEFQCIVQYQRKVNSDFINHRWTEEEDEMLKYLVERCRVNDYVPWATVAMCMKNRTRQQVYNRWTFSIDPSIKKGRFTVEEDCLILAGVKHFGLDFARIAELLPGRTTAQINARYKMCLSRDGPLGQWSVEEDMKLLKMVEIHGKKWQWLALEHFAARSRSQIRHRFVYLEDWLSKNPNCSVSMAPRRDLGDSCRRNSKLWTTIQTALRASNKTRKDKEINKEDMELLKLTMTTRGKRRRFGPQGRKKKVFTDADKLLHQLSKSCYLFSSGRSKAIFTDEEFKKMENVTLKLMNGLQAHLAFPFDESIIKDDPAWNLCDQSILLGLKKIYDQQNCVESPLRKSGANVNIASEGCDGGNSAQANANVRNKPCAEKCKLFSSVPLYKPQENVTPFPENFPGFIRNLIGFRTVLLSRTNLRMWKAAPAEKSISLPALRPTSIAFQDKGKRCFSKEESAKLFSERMFSLFFWPTQLVRVPPEFDDTMLVQPAPSVENMSSPALQPPKRRKKRTMKDQVRSKKLLMRERWKKYREEKNKSRAGTGHSSSRRATSARRKTELELS